MTPEEQLRARPTFEQAEREYLAMLQEMRTALSAVVPALRWRRDTPRQSDRAACRPPFTDVRGADAGTYDSGDAFGAIPDADWLRARQAVTDIAARHGFTTLNELTAKPGNHVIDVIGSWGQTVQLGTAENTTLVVLGPCLLHEDGHPTATGTS